MRVVRRLGRESVFHFMRQGAEFLVSTSGGIALEGVNDAANAPNNLWIASVSLELQARLIELLQ